MTADTGTREDGLMTEVQGTTEVRVEMIVVMETEVRVEMIVAMATDDKREGFTAYDKKRLSSDVYKIETGVNNLLNGELR